MLTPNAACTLYLQTGPGAYTRVYVSACFWQENAESTTIIIPGMLPEQYKGAGREHDYIIKGERVDDVTDTESKRALIADKPLTVESLAHYAYGDIPHCEVIAK